jgi:hypothetical protein
MARGGRGKGEAMSNRGLILLIALATIGNAEALATAPQIVDPREDMFESNSKSLFQRPERNAAPKPVQGAPARLDPPPAAPRSPASTTAEPAAPAANPLWAIPLGRLTETRNRPVFSQTRRPPAIAIVKPAAALAAAAKPFEPEKPPLSLVGTVAGGEGGGIGLFVNTADKSVVRLKAGENHRGWVLRLVRPHQVELAKGLDSAVLDLPPPDMKPAAGAAPGLPPPPRPAMPGSPANAALPASVGPPGATPAAGQRGPIIVVRPPVLNPPPAPVNPFRNGRLP